MNINKDVEKFNLVWQMHEYMCDMCAFLGVVPIELV